MKKIIILLLLALVIFAGCGEPGDTTTADDTTTNGTTIVRNIKSENLDTIISWVNSISAEDLSNSNVVFDISNLGEAINSIPETEYATTVSKLQALDTAIKAKGSSAALRSAGGVSRSASVIGNLFMAGGIKGNSLPMDINGTIDDSAEYDAFDTKSDEINSLNTNEYTAWKYDNSNVENYKAAFTLSHNDPSQVPTGAEQEVINYLDILSGISGVKFDILILSYATSFDIKLSHISNIDVVTGVDTLNTSPLDTLKDNVQSLLLWLKDNVVVPYKVSLNGLSYDLSDFDGTQSATKTQILDTVNAYGNDIKDLIVNGNHGLSVDQNITEAVAGDIADAVVGPDPSYVTDYDGSTITWSQIASAISNNGGSSDLFINGVTGISGTISEDNLATAHAVLKGNSSQHSSEPTLSVPGTFNTSSFVISCSSTINQNNLDSLRSNLSGTLFNVDVLNLDGTCSGDIWMYPSANPTGESAYNYFNKLNFNNVTISSLNLRGSMSANVGEYFDGTVDGGIGLYDLLDDLGISGSSDASKVTIYQNTRTNIMDGVDANGASSRGYQLYDLNVAPSTYMVYKVEGRDNNKKIDSAILNSYTSEQDGSYKMYYRAFKNIKVVGGTTLQVGTNFGVDYLTLENVSIDSQNNGTFDASGSAGVKFKGKFNHINNSSIDLINVQNGTLFGSVVSTLRLTGSPNMSITGSTDEKAIIDASGVTNNGIRGNIGSIMYIGDQAFSGANGVAETTKTYANIDLNYNRCIDGSASSTSKIDALISSNNIAALIKAFEEDMILLAMANKDMTRT